MAVKRGKKINKSTRKKIYLISNYNLISDQLKKLKLSIKLKKVISINERTKNYNLKIIDIPLKYENPFNVSKKNSSNVSTEKLCEFFTSRTV